jgi:hypothetical protein
VHLLGIEKAGPWVLLARPLCGTDVARTAVDYDGFRFEKVRLIGDDMLLPGALKYGGLAALGAAAVPAEIYDHNHHGTGSGHWINTVYKSAGAADKLVRNSEKQPLEKVIDWLLR